MLLNERGDLKTEHEVDNLHSWFIGAQVSFGHY